MILEGGGVGLWREKKIEMEVKGKKGIRGKEKRKTMHQMIPCKMSIFLVGYKRFRGIGCKGIEMCSLT